MKGKFHIVVQNNRLRYEFDVRRNITIIRGDSATGKTTLYEMIALAARSGDNSGVEVQCEKHCRTLEEPDWRLVLPTLRDQILFLDEGNRFLKTTEFAGMVKRSDNYFVIITREELVNLPYSVEEVYGIHTSGKYHDMKRVYHEFYHIYSAKKIQEKVKPDQVIVEDSNSGYEFFSDICAERGIRCVNAGGKSKIIDRLQKSGGGTVLVIADGASIGPEMNELTQFMRIHTNTKCYLPESFEWIILKSGLIGGSEVRTILEHPEDFIESQLYFSWERFFTGLLVQYTKDTYFNYNKHKLNGAYLHKRSKAAIMRVMEGIVFEENCKKACEEKESCS